MLTIRNEQVQIFSKMVQHSFEDRTAAHLWSFFPQRCRKAGDAGLRLMIRFGIRRAAFHGINRAPDVRRYLDLMMVLGHHFDTNPRYPWVRDILTIYQSPSSRLHFLHLATRDYLRGRSNHA